MIRLIEENDVPNALELINSQLGDGYVSEITPNGYQFGLFVADKLITYSSCRRLSEYEANEMVRFNRFGGEVIYFETTVTHPDYQRMGLGTELKLEMIAKLGNLPMFSTLWQSKNGINAERMNLACGFVRERELANFYTQWKNCPDCGMNSKCQCSAWLFVRE